MIESIPSDAPSWGQLKKVLDQVLAHQKDALMCLILKAKDKYLINFQAQHLTDQLTVLLYHWRRTCNSPQRYLQMMKHADAEEQLVLGKLNSKYQSDEVAGEISKSLISGEAEDDLIFLTLQLNVLLCKLQQFLHIPTS